MTGKTRFHEGRLTVSHLMSEQPTVVPQGTPMEHVVELLRTSQFPHVLVADSHGNVIGVVSNNDVLAQMAEWATDERAKQKPVASVMTTKLVTSTPDADAEDIAHLLVSGDIQCVPVMEADRLIGVMTADDLLLSWNRLDPLLKEAASDAVTGLASRATFDRRLLEEWERAMRSGQSLGLVLIDIDKFKGINDQYGHLTGDAVLCMVGSCLRRNLRVYDVVARFGGDEFVALCCSCRPTDIDAPIKRLQSAMQTLSFPCGTIQKAITLSIGACIIRSNLDELTPEQLIDAADQCVYRAKDEGRNRAYWTALEPDRPIEDLMRLVGDHDDNDTYCSQPIPESTSCGNIEPNMSEDAHQEIVSDGSQEKEKDLMEAYAGQVTGLLERLAFLEEMLHMVNSCDTDTTFRGYAKSVLSSLSRTFEAHSLILVPAGQQCDDGRFDAGNPVVWEGEPFIDAASCRLLVQHFREAAAGRPVVKNRVQDTRLGKIFPGLASFILVPVVGPKAPIGWLVALQRIPPTRIRRPDDIWRLSESEFGTDEAQMVSSAANLLTLFVGKAHNCGQISADGAVILDQQSHLLAAAVSK